VVALEQRAAFEHELVVQARDWVLAPPLIVDPPRVLYRLDAQGLAPASNGLWGAILAHGSVQGLGLVELDGVGAEAIAHADSVAENGGMSSKVQ
jgi:hypothetical protein